jgi:hypothetical protein
MKFYTTIPKHVRLYYLNEVEQYKASFKRGDLIHAWFHLERAHVIGQSYPIEHSRTHWLMLKFGFAIKDRKEILGQIPRLLIGGLKSFVGQIPVGNTGGANVPPLKPMPVPHDIQKILEK